MLGSALSCASTPAPCDDENVCTDDRDDPTQGCVHSANTRPCDDGDPMTIDDSCEMGSCIGGPPPRVQDDFATTEEGTELVLDVRANDLGFSDAAVRLMTGPDHGEATVAPDGTITYRADVGFNGTDTFTYEATNADGLIGVGSAHITTYTAATSGAPVVLLPRIAMTRREIAVIVNEDDADSVAIGRYYATRRNIPPQHVITVSLGADVTGRTTMDPGAFKRVRDEVEAACGPKIQAYAIAWTAPYRVAGMSMTSAFALGYDPKYESSPCAHTAPVPTFASESTQNMGVPWPLATLR
mgnify:CR=1 FL=1